MLPNQSIYRISPTGDSHSTVLNDIDTRNLQSVRIGESAGTISRGSHNVFAGVGAGTQNTTGSYQTMIGYYAGNAAQNANYSVGIGAYALAQNQGVLKMLLLVIVVVNFIFQVLVSFQLEPIVVVIIIQVMAMLM